MRIATQCLVALVGLVTAGCAVVSQSNPGFGQLADTQPAFTCKTEIGTFRVSPGNNEAFRLQLPGNSIQVEGSERIEGSSVCAYSIWTFQSGQKQYLISELGCYPDDNQPPAGSKGRLEISENGANAKGYWCY